MGGLDPVNTPAENQRVALQVTATSHLQISHTEAVRDRFVQHFSS